MMKTLLAGLASALLALATALPALALESNPSGAGQAFAAATPAPSTQDCPRTAADRLDLAGFAQSDCCKGHKGVCGCRAGKIVCCDGSASETCTCHGDAGFPN